MKVGHAVILPGSLPLLTMPRCLAEEEDGTQPLDAESDHSDSDSELPGASLSSQPSDVFRPGDMVWAKYLGLHWPAIVTLIKKREKKGKGGGRERDEK